MLARHNDKTLGIEHKTAVVTVYTHQIPHGAFWDEFHHNTDKQTQMLHQHFPV